MPKAPKVADEVIASHIRNGLTIGQICEKENIGWGTCVQQRFRRIAAKHNLTIASGLGSGNKSVTERKAEAEWDRKLRAHSRKHFSIGNGIALIGSDAHYWPGRVSTAHRAFCKLARELKPSAVVMNGDASDGAATSRWPRIGWDRKPGVQDELEACKQRMAEIEEAAGTKNLFWPLGNHDSRYETFLAAKVPEFEGVEGFQLKYHFPYWTPCWSVWINEDVVVKHRFKGGIHATHNNTLWSGKTIVTGHLHSLKVTPFTDYRGTRFGIDCGTLAEVSGPQFTDYTEDNPLNWRAGFAVLTFWNGQLLDPELVRVLDEDKGRVVFRGQVIEV